MSLRNWKTNNHTDQSDASYTEMSLRLVKLIGQLGFLFIHSWEKQPVNRLLGRMVHGVRCYYANKTDVTVAAEGGLEAVAQVQANDLLTQCRYTVATETRK